MKSCNFDPNICSVECKKYPICAYYSIQKQFIEVQSQLNFIYSTIPQILETNETIDTKLNLIEEIIRQDIPSEIDDSETIK